MLVDLGGTDREDDQSAAEQAGAIASVVNVTRCQRLSRGNAPTVMHQRWEVSRQQKTPRRAEGLLGFAMRNSAEADLGQDALAGQELGAEADHDAQHGQTTVPGLSEVDEPKRALSDMGGNRLVWDKCNTGWSFVECVNGYAPGFFWSGLLAAQPAFGSGRRQRLSGIVGPGVLGVAPPHLPAHLPVTALPEAFEVTGALQGASGW